jgi:hypothetical protein
LSIDRLHGGDKSVLGRTLLTGSTERRKKQGVRRLG